MLNRRQFVACGGSILLPIHRAAAHGAHAAFTIIEQNERAGTLEVIHRLMVLDLELALTARTGRRIRMEEAVNDKGESLVSGYIADYFSISASAEAPISLTWVGMALEVDTLLAYQEAPLPETLSELVVANQLLTETHPSQVNTVNVTYDGRTQSHLFVLGDPPQSFDLS